MTAAPRDDDASMQRALGRFRGAAYVVGVMLLILVLVAMPLKYLADRPGAVAVVGPIHGFMYMGYLVVAFDLAVRAKWRFMRTLLVLLAGTIPGLSFVAERRVTSWIRARVQEPAPR
jgi:integral membrane protein